MCFTDKDKSESILCWQEGGGGKAVRGEPGVGESGGTGDGKRKETEKGREESKRGGKGRQRERKGELFCLFSVPRKITLYTSKLSSDNQHLYTFSVNLSKCMTHAPAF